MSDAVKEFLDVLNDRLLKKPKPFDRQGVVKRVEGKTAFVRFNGSNIETPVQLTIDCKPGDTVQTRVAGRNAWLVGNLTAPPTDDRVAKEAKIIARNVEKKSTEQFVHIGGLIDEQGKQIVYAIESANGKNTIYHSDTEPTGGEYKVGDTWFNSSEGYAIYRWDGTNWLKEEFGADAIEDLAITNAKIADGTIQDAKIGTVDVGKLTGDYIDARHINVNSLNIGIANVSGLEQALADADGNAWYTGTVMTYTDTSAHIYSDSGITNASIGDLYLNTNTNNVYRCTVGGGANIAQWVYTSSIQGADGEDGADGHDGQDGQDGQDGNDGRGISSITLYSTSGKTKTYKITYTDGAYTFYDVEDGTDVTSQYVTTITGRSGICVHAANDTSNYGNFNSNGMTVYKGGVDVASFGETQRIGKLSSDTMNLLVDTNQLRFRENTDTLMVIGTNESISYFTSLLSELRIALSDDEPSIKMKAPRNSSELGYVQIWNYGNGGGSQIELNEDGTISISAEDASGNSKYINMSGAGLNVVGQITQNANKAVVDKSMIQSGSTGAVTVPANTHLTTNVSFSFSSVPKVTCSIYSESTNVSQIADVSVWADNVTTTGCKIHFYNKSSMLLKPAVHWIATVL